MKPKDVQGLRVVLKNPAVTKGRWVFVGQGPNRPCKPLWECAYSVKVTLDDDGNGKKLVGEVLKGDSVVMGIFPIKQESAPRNARKFSPGSRKGLSCPIAFTLEDPPPFQIGREVWALRREGEPHFIHTQVSGWHVSVESDMRRSIGDFQYYICTDDSSKDGSSDDMLFKDYEVVGTAEETHRMTDFIALYLSHDEWKQVIGDRGLSEKEKAQQQGENDRSEWQMPEIMPYEYHTVGICNLLAWCRLYGGLIRFDVKRLEELINFRAPGSDTPIFIHILEQIYSISGFAYVPDMPVFSRILAELGIKRSW